MPGYQPCRVTYHNSTTGKEEISQLCTPCALRLQRHSGLFYIVKYIIDDTYGAVKDLQLFDTEKDTIKYLKEEIMIDKESGYYFEKDVCLKHTYNLFQKEIKPKFHVNFPVEIASTNLNLSKYEVELFN